MHHMTQRWLYAGLMRVAYLSLFGIALYHNEGSAGFAFRATLGVMLYTPPLRLEPKRNRQAVRNIQKDWRVKRYACRLARQEAMADLDLDTRMRRLDRKMKERLYTLQVERDTRSQLQVCKSNDQKPFEMVNTQFILR
jgi:hypothetical protein